VLLSLTLSPFICIDCVFATTGTASSGVVGYNCNYKRIAVGADGLPYDHLSYVQDARGKLIYSGDKWQCVE
jgi:hypothetical protein